MGKSGRLIIIAAPSGTGKTTVIRHFMSKHPELVYSISSTTRPKRPNEINGKDYNFLNKKSFEEGIKKGEFAEWANVHEHIYGTPKKPLDLWLSQGKEVLLDVDVVGSLNLKKLYGDRAVSIFLLPPTMDELKKRLLSRATDSKEQQEIRLKNALTEMNYKDKFDHQVINDVLEKACKEIEKILMLDQTL